MKRTLRNLYLLAVTVLVAVLLAGCPNPSGNDTKDDDGGDGGGGGGGGTSASDAITLTMGSWKTATIGLDTQMWFSAAVSAGSTYKISWDDADADRGVYDVDLKFYGYRADGTTTYFADTDFGDGDDADGTIYKNVTIASGETIAYVVADSEYWNDQGEFRVKIELVSDGDDTGGDDTGGDDTDGDASGYDLTVAIDSVTLDETDGKLDVTYTVTNGGDTDVPATEIFSTDIKVAATDSISAAETMSVSLWASAYPLRNPADLTPGESVTYSAADVSTALETALTSGYVWVVVRDVDGESDTTNNTSTAASFASTGTPASTDATLSALAISEGTLSATFDADTTSYTVSAENSVTSLTVTPTVNDTGATVTVDGTAVTSGSASSEITLEEGSNTITVVVTAEDGTTTKSYTITVTRTAAPMVTELQESSFITGKASYSRAKISTDGNTLYMVESDGTFTVFDISNPSSPVASGSVATNVGADTVVLEGNYAYVFGPSYIDVVDISTSSSPAVVLDNLNHAAADADFSADGNTMYLGDSYGNVKILDVSDLSNVTVVGEADVLSYYNLKNDTTPTETLSVYSVALDETRDRLYVGHYYGLAVYDVSNTASPTQIEIEAIGEASTFSNDFTYSNSSQYSVKGFDDLVLDGTTLYVAADYDGLLIFDVTTLTAIERNYAIDPEVFDSLETGFNRVNDLFVDTTNDVAYIGDFDNGLFVLDISNPGSPSMTKKYAESPAYQNEFVVSPDFSVAFIATGNDSDGHPIIDLDQE